jgi:hypothetical protein
MDRVDKILTDELSKTDTGTTPRRGDPKRK